LNPRNEQKAPPPESMVVRLFRGAGDLANAPRWLDESGSHQLGLFF